MNSEKNTLRVNVFLHKENVEEFSDCLRSDLSNENVDVFTVKKSIGLPGKIFVHEPTSNSPDWESDLNQLTDSNVELQKNISNRAIVILKYSKRFFSITFGYGRYMLDFDSIVNNFGLKVAANIIDSNSVKSLSSTSFESSVLHTQKQVPKSINQDQFRINKDLELLKEVSGIPSSESTANFVTGSSSLKIIRKMDVVDIKESIEFFYEKYNSKDYISKGFGWIDNIQQVKDRDIIEALENQLCKNIILDNSEVVITANRVDNWDLIQGYSFEGIGKNDIVSESLDQTVYLSALRESIAKRGKINILRKLKKDHILQYDISWVPNRISTVFKGIHFDTVYEGKRYLLEEGDWYQISENFYDAVVERIKNVPTNTIKLPESFIEESEGQYNTRVGEEEDIVCLDKNNFMFDGFGRSKMEPCDLVTRDKKFVHVKVRKGNGSSVLSHWFAQGKISAEVLNQDKNFKKFINEQVSDKFGKNFISDNDRNNNFEIVFALIVEKGDKLIDNLPFFSMVNLVNTIDELATSDFQYSFCLVKKETLNTENLEQLELLNN